MKKMIFILLSCFSVGSLAGQDLQSLPVYDMEKERRPHQDWLIHPVSMKAAVYRDKFSKNIILANGLAKRVFRLQPSLTCIDYTNLVTGEQLVRSVKPEARIILNGREYIVGGLQGQKENAYLQPDWLSGMKAINDDFVYEDYEIKPAAPYLQWKPSAWGTNRHQPAGIEIAFSYYSKRTELSGVYVKVHYILYDGIPLLCKWISIKSLSNTRIKINRVVNEILGMPEEESAVVGATESMKKPHGIYIESNYAFNNSMRYDLSDQTTHWKADSSYTSQVNYDFKTPCLLEVYVEKGPGVEITNKQDSFSSIRTYELLMDSYDRERRGLCIRQMYRKIAPWTTQNPMFMHLVSKSDEDVTKAIDQCAMTGYEALILSFGSHCDIEDTSAANIRKWTSLADAAHRKHILIGSYSLFSSRRISDEDDVIDPLTLKPDAAAFFGHAPCYGSRWGLAYLNKLKFFIRQTGFNIFENDGPYPGDVCASTTHPGHTGLDDSQWKQMELQKDLYHWCNEQGVYVNAPDWYFLDGTNKISLGYREVNFSLPREQQMILNRQNIYDGTWEKTGPMSWGFVPLTKYQGGGADAVLEPLQEHLSEYKQLMVQYYGAGIQACYRGPRLFDSEKTKQVVIAMINWYKKYRTILNADIIHLRRADGRDWDGWLHVDPSGKEKGMLLIFNPLKEKITRTIEVPLYYTGLSSTARVREQDGTPRLYTIGRNYAIRIELSLESGAYTWYSIE